MELGLLKFCKMTDNILLNTWQTNIPSLANRYQMDNGKSLDLLLKKENIDVNFFTEMIALFDSEEKMPVTQLKSFDLLVILDYLEKTHCYYLDKKLMEIEQVIFNLEKNIPENTLLPFLGTFFIWVKENLIFHIKMEEEQLFPYIKSLYYKTCEVSNFTIQHFIDSHTDTIELQISEVKKHIVRAQSSANDIFPFRILLRHLDDFEKDLRIHATIEDEVLIPLAKKLEEEFRAKS